MGGQGSTQSEPQRVHNLEDALAALRDRQGGTGRAAVRGVRLWRESHAPVVLTLQDGERYVVGRHDAADLVFDAPCVSRVHGMLRFVDGQWLYEDYDSHNGTRLRTGGAAMEVAPHTGVPLQVGDILEVGGPAARLEAVGEDGLEPSGETTATGGANRSAAARQFVQRVELAARTRLPVFLLGPSGCGKTHTAREIHRRSAPPGLFVPINCARLPQDSVALHSELLGHVRGAFTGADHARTGKLFHAHQGTLFLDEVESLSELAQGFLLDVLEGSGDLAPLGAREVGVKAPVFRLISASKVPLGQSSMRPDLCERLAEGHTWRLPGLNERREDIAGLLREFAQEQERLLGVSVVLETGAVKAAVAAPWPGQIRQLRAMVSTLCQSRLAVEAAGATLSLSARDVARHLAEREEAFAAGALADGPDVAPLTKADPRQLTREQVRNAMAQAQGNQSRAARALGIARNTLAARIREYRL